MGYKMNRNSASPFDFGEGTGRSPLNNGEKKAGVVARTWDNPKGAHIDEQVKKHGGPRTAAVPPDLDLKPEPGPRTPRPSSTEPPTEKPSPANKTSPLNQVRGQQRMNPSTLKPHVEHGTGRGSRTGKGIKHSHTI